MSLRAVKFISSGRDIRPLRKEIGADARESFARLKSQAMNGVYIMRNHDLESFSATDDIFIVRARKSKAQELSRLLLGQKKIPVFSGDYTSAGRLIQGIEALLKRAAKRGDSNIYIIGAEDRVFNELWENIEARTSRKRGEIKDGSHQEALDESTEPRHLLELLPHCEIPDELAQTYIGDSIEAQLVRHLIVRAAGHDYPVLITGDTGTGKEVVAHAIHQYSERSSRPFVPVNCGAIPRELLEAVLFGSVHGVATSVMTRAGLWELAQDGTLFLDEIGDLAVDHQVKILRALEEKTIRRVGEFKERRVNARVIAATNRDLFSMVRVGQFREDLYYRLRSFLIRTPSLKNHPDDARTLSVFLWKKITHNEQATLPEEILAKLAARRWPGNVREIKAVLMNIYTLFGGDRLSVKQLSAVLQLQGQAVAYADSPTREDEINLHRIECLRHLRRVDEVIRACEVALKPVVEDGMRDTHTVKFAQPLLSNHLSELEMLCLRPLLFNSEVTYAVVYRLKGKLSYFYSLIETDTRQAVSYWKSNVLEESKLALSAIFREVEQITTYKARR